MKENRTKLIPLRVTKTEFKAIKEAAKLDNRKVADFTRVQVLKAVDLLGGK